MSKYDPLYHHLKKLSATGRDVWHASFEEIEKILDSKLPESASKRNAWWANEYKKSTHVQCRAWLKTGWKTEGLNLGSKKIIFRKVSA